MYLTKLIIPLENRKAAEALGDCQKMHRLVCSVFSAGRDEENLLYRVNVVHGSIQIYSYSEHRAVKLPDGVHLAGQRDMSEWLETLSEGNCMGFDLLVSPSKKVYQPEMGKNSQRRILRNPTDRLNWLNRKAEQNGFRILDVREVSHEHSYGRHVGEKGGALHIDAYHYQGSLRVADEELFRKAVQVGIGPGKAYGLGMMMVKSL